MPGKYIRENTQQADQATARDYVREIEEELDLFLNSPTYDKLGRLQRLTAALLRYALAMQDSRLYGKLLDLLSRQWVLEYGMIRDTAMHQMSHLQALILSALEEEPRAKEKIMRLLIDTASSGFLMQSEEEEHASPTLAARNGTQAVLKPEEGQQST